MIIPWLSGREVPPCGREFDPIRKGFRVRKKHMRHDFVGFGFGPIQAGLFAAEARQSGRFTDIVVSEIDAELVESVRRNGDCYAVNVAGSDGVETLSVKGVRLLNPREAQDRSELEVQLGKATEAVTSLPSVNIFKAGGTESVAGFLSRAMQREHSPALLVYTAENNNHAAEILQDGIRDISGGVEVQRPVQFLNTVIGKMSQVVSDEKEIEHRGLIPIVPGFPKAFLVEAFNHILVSRVVLPGFEPGIQVFEQKEDLLPFEETKLYGHNAIHTLLGFFGQERGCLSMAQLRDFPDIMELARRAFVEEAGAALTGRYAHLNDPLFTQEGFLAYAGDLLLRMTNPWLDDAVARIVRDPLRKLGYADRVFGPIRLCLEQGVEPRRLAAGARAGIRCLLRESEDFDLPLSPEAASRDWTAEELHLLLKRLWGGQYQPEEADPVVRLLLEG